jgi:hypothetical protein
MARKKKDPTPALPDLDAHRHQDTRKNIPTEELRDFVAEGASLEIGDPYDDVPAMILSVNPRS